jgi:Flp pilus assembly protein TadD
VAAIEQSFPAPPRRGEIPPGFERATARLKRVTPRFAVAAATAVLSFWTFPLAAQTTKIDGVVRVGTGQEETGGATVKLYDPQLGLVDSTMTNTQGRFYFQGVRTGEYTLVTSKPGYYTKEQELKVQFTMAEQYVTVFLTPEGELMKGKGNLQVSAAELALPPKIRDEFEKGKNELRKRKYAAAIHHLKAVTDAQPQFALGLEVLGVAYYRSGDSGKAAAAFQKALELDSKRGECYIQLGLLSYEQNRFAESQKYLQTGLGIEPDSWFGHYQLGLTLFALGNYPQSETELRKAEELDPSYHEVHVRLGNLYLRKAEAAKALAEFEHYLRKDPNGRFAPRVRQVVKEMRTAGVAPPS